MSEVSRTLPLCLTIRRCDGWEIINYDDAERLSVTVKPVSCLSKDAFHQQFDNLQRGANDLCVFHFPVRSDPRVFQIVDELIADVFDLPTCFFTAEYQKGVAYSPREHFRTRETGHEVLGSLNVGHGSVVSRSRWKEIKKRQAVARLTIAQLYEPQGEAA